MPHLATEHFRKQAGFNGAHVPYNSSPVALTEHMPEPPMVIRMSETKRRVHA